MFPLTNSIQFIKLWYSWRSIAGDVETTYHPQRRIWTLTLDLQTGPKLGWGHSESRPCKRSFQEFKSFPKMHKAPYDLVPLMPHSLEIRGSQQKNVLAWALRKHSDSLERLQVPSKSYFVCIPPCLPYICVHYHLFWCVSIACAIIITIDCI